MASVAHGVIDPIVDHIDEHFLQEEGKIRADKLIMNNRTYAETPEKVKDEVKNINRKIFEGRWGRTRDLLLLSQTDMEQFTILLNLTTANLSDALSLFQSIGGSKKGVLDRSDIANILNLGIEDQKMYYIYNALDASRDGQINFKEFLIVAAHFNSYISPDARARFCFKMLDANNYGYVSFDELRDYILDFRYSNKFARARGRLKIETMMNEKLNMESFDNLTEEEFSLMFQKNPKIFEVLLDIHKQLQALFTESFKKAQTEIPLTVISKYFNEDLDQATSRASTARSVGKKSAKTESRPTYNAYRPVKGFRAIRRLSRDDDLIFMEMRRGRNSPMGSARKFSKDDISIEEVKHQQKKLTEWLDDRTVHDF